jgi:hypothetical protein
MLSGGADGEGVEVARRSKVDARSVSPRSPASLAGELTQRRALSWRRSSTPAEQRIELRPIEAKLHTEVLSQTARDSAW